MRILLAAALLLSFAGNAAGLQKAHPSDVADIKKKIDLANTTRRAADEAYAALAELDEESPNPKIKKRVKELQEKGFVNLNASIAAYRQAVWLTVRAYDILPFIDEKPLMDEGTSVFLSPEKGKKIVWIPLQSDFGDYPLQDEAGRRLVKMRTITEKNLGNTASDGVSYIFPSAFTSPGELALIINHEYRHFKQNITPGKSDWKTSAELEVEALEEELRLLDTFGISGDDRTFQVGRITKQLDGSDGKPGKRKLAVKERAEADKNRGGRPLSENSITSQPEEDIQYLIREAHEQAKIAQVEHDDRLRRRIIDLTRRACSHPGSVSQRELDDLPKPHRYEFAYDKDPNDPGAKVIPPGVGLCQEIYRYISQQAGHRDGAGPNAEVVKQMAMPPPPQDQPRELNPTSPGFPPSPREFSAKIPFAPALSRFREFASSSCRAPISIYVDKGLMSPSLPYGFSPGDADAAAALEAGLDACSVKLFRRLIQVIRSGEGNLISAEWVREEVSRFSPAPEPRAPRGVSPPRDGDDRSPPNDPDHGRVWDRIGPIIGR